MQALGCARTRSDMPTICIQATSRHGVILYICPLQALRHNLVHARMTPPCVGYCGIHGSSMCRETSPTYAFMHVVPGIHVSSMCGGICPQCGCVLSRDRFVVPTRNSNKSAKKHVVSKQIHVIAAFSKTKQKGQQHTSMLPPCMAQRGINVSYVY